jgi:hypothetical protein
LYIAREPIFVAQPFHDFINSTHYYVLCLFTERNHTILNVARKSTITIAGSTVEGMRGGIYSNQRHGGDDDLLFRKRTIKLYPPLKNNANNPLPLLNRVSKSFGIEDFDGLVIFKKFIPTEFGKYSLSSIISVQFTSANDSLTYPALGFSKSEREINRHYEHSRNLLMNILRVARKSTITTAGSTVEGMRGDTVCHLLYLYNSLPPMIV